jgi:hypothetical protein
VAGYYDASLIDEIEVGNSYLIDNESFGRAKKMLTQKKNKAA